MQAFFKKRRHVHNAVRLLSNPKRQLNSVILEMINHFFSPRLISFCDDHNDFKSSCDTYNTFFQRLQWAERRNRCNAEQGCVFVGRRLTGTCCPRDPLNPPRSENKKEDGLVRVKLYAEIVSDLANGKDILPIQVLVKETIKSSAVESLRDSQLLANQLAKDLVIDIFKHPESTRKLGEILKYMFNYENVLAPTRSLVYWSLKLPPTVASTVTLVNSQRDYFFIGEGEAFTSRNVSLLVRQWLQNRENMHSTVFPLVNSILTQQNAASLQPIVHDAAIAIRGAEVSNVKLNVLSLPFLLHRLLLLSLLKAPTVGALTWAVTHYLKSETSK